MSLESLFEEVRQWQRKTFPTATAKSVAKHLSKEAEELLADPTELSELADVFILAIGVADQLGADIFDVIECKLEINKEREWGEPDEHGVIEHVRDVERWDNEQKYKVSKQQLEENRKKLSADEPQTPAWKIRMMLDGEMPT